ncbi:hypothetical protein CERZMDRAFT_121680 [Cercospora zeae-maydis SCOH1-5]|uniref:Nitrogen regulatory protein areA GATA-like domain-containing protein n=1 Tax=Cercospora zeae-maydis SCOH1-5 TaxID=717836 RepID=A0A6A6FBS9_9PEZI|nr:hypothetical protein CERZMDRAFT_121680 [Cercospora zeae-maydis SCOH1-5]
MTEVLSLSMPPDSSPYYQRPLPHSMSSSPLLFGPEVPRSPAARPPSAPPAEHHHGVGSAATPWDCTSPPTPAATSFAARSRATSDGSVASSSNSSVASDVSEDTDITFPNYDGDCAPAGHSIGRSDRCSDEPGESPATDPTFSDSPIATATVVDDTAVRHDPSRQVDFLSHDWREEDIWSSWRHIVSQRKTLYGERSRLENASWRTWAKTKFDLRTVSPETLNWLKESDVTWLYGPLKLATSYPVSDRTGSHITSPLSKNNSFINKKPILKKRSVSEVMLQKSLSTSSLLKQAAASVQAQDRQHRRSGPEVVDSKLQSETPSRDQVDYFSSRSNSTADTPGENQEKRHIRFDDRVEQCIAVDCKDVGQDEEDFESDGDDGEEHPEQAISDSSSDDGVVMMKRKKRSAAKRRPTGSRSNSASGRKIIETLPATTLKYRTDSPDIAEEAHHHTFERSWSTGNLSPSPSQETLRPTNPSTNFLLPADEDAEEEEIESDSSWSFGISNPKSSLGASAKAPPRNAGKAPRPVDFQVEGMRRTESGMFMPLDEYEDEIVEAGLFGRVSETINTARDIAHVIWNVGWRK